jgi:hypothetical protein
LKDDLLDFSERYHELEHFYNHQRPSWEKLRKARERFQLNRLELDRDAQAGPALKRMQEILSAPCPYGLVKEAEGLTGTVGTVNSALLTERRQQAVQKIDGHYATMTKDMASVNADPTLRAACLKPLETLRQQVVQEESLRASQSTYLTPASPGLRSSSESRARSRWPRAVGRGRSLWWSRSRGSSGRLRW